MQSTGRFEELNFEITNKIGARFVYLSLSGQIKFVISSYKSLSSANNVFTQPPWDDTQGSDDTVEE